MWPRQQAGRFVHVSGANQFSDAGARYRLAVVLGQWNGRNRKSVGTPVNAEISRGARAQMAEAKILADEDRFGAETNGENPGAKLRWR